MAKHDARRLGLGELSMRRLTNRDGTDLHVISQDAIPEILQSYLLATNLDPTWYKAWHAWALANSEVVAHYGKANPDARISDFKENILIDHLVPSVHGRYLVPSQSPEVHR